MYAGLVNMGWIRPGCRMDAEQIREVMVWQDGNWLNGQMGGWGIDEWIKVDAGCMQEEQMRIGYEMSGWDADNGCMRSGYGLSKIWVQNGQGNERMRAERTNTRKMDGRICDGQRDGYKMNGQMQNRYGEDGK